MSSRQILNAKRIGNQYMLSKFYELNVLINFLPYIDLITLSSRNAMNKTSN